jgi:hypothetical protein
LPITSEDVAALIVPQGKVVDFVDGKLRNETPEEYVRQEIEKSLVREYKYPREEIRVEFRVKMGSSGKRADLVIFPEGEAQKQENVWAIVECKAENVPPSHKKEGVEQLKAYLSACINAEFGMWTNGRERVCYRKTTGPDPYVEIVEGRRRPHPRSRTGARPLSPHLHGWERVRGRASREAAIQRLANFRLVRRPPYHFYRRTLLDFGRKFLVIACRLIGFPSCDINRLFSGIDSVCTFAGGFLPVKRLLGVESMKLNDVSSGLCNWKYGKYHLPLLADPKDSVAKNLWLIAIGGEIQRCKPTIIYRLLAILLENHTSYRQSRGVKVDSKILLSFILQGDCYAKKALVGLRGGSCLGDVKLDSKLRLLTKESPPQFLLLNA